MVKSRWLYHHYQPHNDINCNERHNIKKPRFEKESLIKHYINNDNTDQQQLMLCNAHYQEVYKHFKISSIPCASCGNYPRRGAAYTRHCPNPSVIKYVSGCWKHSWEFFTQYMLFTFWIVVNVHVVLLWRTCNNSKAVKFNMMH